MKFPGIAVSQRSLIEQFEMKPEHAAELAEICDEATARLTPKKIAEALIAANVMIDGHGTEAIFEGGGYTGIPAIEYVNMGDTYLQTIYFERTRQAFFIGSWGDWLEWAESEGMVFA